MKQFKRLQHLFIHQAYAYLAGSCGFLCALSAQGAEDIKNGPISVNQYFEVREIASEVTAGFALTWGDYDNDGFLDLFEVAEDGYFIWHNKGDESFEKLTSPDQEHPVNKKVLGSLGVWADYDNDGALDIFVANWRDAPQVPARDNLYRGDGKGGFESITNPLTRLAQNTNHASWADYNLDGWLDLYVTTAADSNRLNHLFQNNGDGTWSDVGKNIFSEERPDTAGVWADVDGDGDPDLLVTHNYAKLSARKTNKLFLNNLGGRERTPFILDDRLSDILVGDERSHGPAFGDYDNDGDLDVFICAMRSTGLFQNQGDGTFFSVFESNTFEAVTDSAINATWADFNNDGWLDLHVTQNSKSEPDYLFMNDQNGNFVTMVLNESAISVGASWGDYNNDGFMDLVVANGLQLGGDEGDEGFPESNILYHNKGNSGNWLKIQCIGTQSNRSAIGTKVRVKAKLQGESIWQMREISGGNSWASQNDPRPNFGLDDAESVEALRIEWPSGMVQEFENIVSNQMLTIIEPREGLTMESETRQFVLNGLPGREYLIQSSSDLNDWDTIGQLKASTKPIEIDWSVDESRTAQYFRAVRHGIE